MEGSEFEKALKVPFVAAATQLTQLYTAALNNHKQAYSEGYSRALRDTAEWAVVHGENGAVSVELLLLFLRSTAQKMDASSDTGSAGGTGPAASAFHFGPQAPASGAADGLGAAADASHRAALHPQQQQQQQQHQQHDQHQANGAAPRQNAAAFAAAAANGAHRTLSSASGGVVAAAAHTRDSPFGAVGRGGGNAFVFALPPALAVPASQHRSDAGTGTGPFGGFAMAAAPSQQSTFGSHRQQQQPHYQSHQHHHPHAGHHQRHAGVSSSQDTAASLNGHAGRKREHWSAMDLSDSESKKSRHDLASD